MSKDIRKARRKATRAANADDRQQERRHKTLLSKSVRKAKRAKRKRDVSRDPKQAVLDAAYKRNKALYGSGTDTLLRQVGRTKR
jgi:hypothetical protein